MSTDPKPTADLDNELDKFLVSSRRALWTVLIALAVWLLGVSILTGFLGVRQLDERARVESIVAQFEASQCGFYYLLGTVEPTPRTTTKTGVLLIEDSRLIVHDLGCAQKLPPPSRALIQLGSKYDVPITY